MEQSVNPTEVEARALNAATQDRQLQNLAMITRNLTQADTCIIWRQDKTRQLLQVAAWEGDVDEAYRQKVCLKVHDEATQQIIKNNQPLFIKDVTDTRHAPFYRHPQEAKKRGWRSLITVPTIHQGQIVALIDCYWKHEYTMRSEQERQRIFGMLSAWAGQVAAVIREAKVTAQLEILLGLNRILNSAVNEEHILYLILSKGSEMVGSDAGWICKVNPSEKDMVIQASQGIPNIQVGDKIPLEGNVSGEAALRGEVVSRSEIGQKVILGLPEQVMVRSEIAVPMRRGDQTIGVLSLMSQYPEYFLEEDSSLLTAYASQAVLALERSRVNQYIRKVSEASRQGTESLLDNVVEAVYELTGKKTSLWLVDERQRELTIAADRGINKEFVDMAVLGVGDSQTGVALREHRIIAIEDISDPNLKPAFKYRKLGEKYQWRSAMIVPLYDSSDQAMGALCVYGATRQRFPQWELDLVSGFANQASIAIENAAYFKAERAMHLQAKASLAISTIASDYSEVDKSAVAYAVLNKIHDFIDFHTGSVQLVNGDQRSLLAGVGFDVRQADPNHTRPISQDRLVSEVIRQRKITIIRNTDEIQDWDPIPDTKAWACMPLMDRERVIGLLTMTHPTVGYFDQIDKDLFNVVGNQVTIALQKTELRTNLRIQMKRLKTINQFSLKINSLLKEEAIFQAVPLAVVKTLECTHCTLFVIKNGWLEPAASFSKEGGAKVKRRFRVGEGLAGKVAVSGDAQLLVNTKQNPDFIAGETRPDLDERSMILVPVKCGDEIVAVISADQDRTSAFDKQDLEMVETLAYQAGLSLQNAQLFREEQRRADAMELLSKISTGLRHPTSLDNLLRTIMKGAIKLTHTESGVVHLVDSSRTKLEHSFSYPKGYDHPGSRFNTGTGITWEVIHNNKIMILEDTQQEGSLASQAVKEAGIQAMVGIPLVIQKKTIGAVFLNEKTAPRKFSEFEIDLLKALAEQAAIAIWNNRLLEQEKEWSKQLSELQQISVDVTSKLGLEDLLGSIIESVLRFTGADLATLFLFDEVTGKFSNGIRRGAFEDEPLLPRENGMWARFTRKRKPLLIPDFTTCTTVHSTFAESEHIQSGAALPLSYQERPVGLLFVNYRSAHHFTDKEAELAKLLANQAAVAIVNAQTFEQRKNDIAALQDINKAITKGSFEYVAELIAKTGKNLTQADACEIWIKRGDFLEMAAIYPKTDAAKVRETRLPIDDKSVNGWTMITNEAYNPEDLHSEFHYLAVRKNIRSNLAVPLRLGWDPIGTISVESGKAIAFGESETGLLQSLADQAAISLENQRLFQEQENRSRQLTELHEITAAIASKQTDLTEVLKLIVETVKGRYNESSCAIRLWDPTTKQLGQQFAAGELANSWFTPRPYGTTRYVINKKTPLFIEDTRDITLPKPHVHKTLRKKQVIAIAYLPLIIQSEVIGILYINLPYSHGFTDDEKELLHIFADDAAITVKTARLFSEVASNEADLTREYLAMDLVHRLNNMLGAIPRRMDLVMENLPEDSTNALVLRHIRGAAEDARKVLTEAKRIFTKPERETITDLSFLLQALGEEILIRSGDRLQITIDCPANIPPIDTIRVNLINAMYSILDNAEDALKKQAGHVLIKAKPIRRDGKSYLEIRISDNGPGIPTAIRGQLFQAGISTKAGGTGYGLWRAKMLIEAIGGSLILDKPEAGEYETTFSIQLPYK